MLIHINIRCSSNWQLKTTPFHFSYKQIDFKLLPDSDSMVCGIEVKKRITMDKKYLAEIKKITSNRSNPEKNFLIHAEDQEIINVIKFFENVLSKEGRLTIDWQTFNCAHLVEDAEEERIQRDAGDFKGWGRITPSLGVVKIEDPAAITCRMEYSEGLDIEFGFFRHAITAAREENFIEAYFNYYLILESYFSGGTHKNQEKIFSSNSTLIKLITELLSTRKFMELVESKIERPITVDKIIDKLVKTRHAIFHFLDIDKPHKRITYAEQEDLRSDISILNAIVWRSMTERHRRIRGAK